uniref:G-protein coupled receptors family 1 profile domain-containing protein n=1 Tax=Salvator merianae TaxID=96440 RepID=A0A8D0BIJ9_SALMN
MTFGGILPLNNSLQETFYYKLERMFFSVFIFFICIFGLLGNGTVFCLLGFYIRKNCFATYILNMAVADSGVLVLLQMFLQINLNLFIVFDTIYSFMFCASQFLLMVISMDRCVSVFFPLWHRCHRPTQLSTIICALIWAFSILPPVICFIIYKELFSSYVMLFQLAANGFLCFPLMTVSSLMLFIKVCCKSKQQRRGKLLITILVTVFFFCFLCFPFNVVYAIYFFFHWKFTLYNYVKFCACLNSSVNPLIYYLVGRPEKGHSNKKRQDKDAAGVPPNSLSCSLPF